MAIFLACKKSYHDPSVHQTEISFYFGVAPLMKVLFMYQIAHADVLWFTKKFTSRLYGSVNHIHTKKTYLLLLHD